MAFGTTKQFANNIYPENNPNWTIDELIDHWTLTPGERAMTKRAIGVNNQLGRALLLKWFQYAGWVPQRKQEIPLAVVQFLARQLEVSPDVFHEFPWNLLCPAGHSPTGEHTRQLKKHFASISGHVLKKGRSIERQRAKIRCPIAENVAAGDINVCFTSCWGYAKIPTIHRPCE